MVKNIIEKANFLIDGLHKKPILADISFSMEEQKKPVIVFSHGFKGFKDWGHYNLMAEGFASEGFFIIKYNFSHNGTTPESPLDLTDLEAFGNNNFSIEMDDLGQVINWLEGDHEYKSLIDTDRIFLIGHSRGGGISILKAREDRRVKKLVTWAAPGSFENRYSVQELEYWKQNQVIFVENTRTNQQMPLFYQIVEDYFSNRSRVNISEAARYLKVPSLFIHGTADDVVELNDALRLKKLYPASELLVIEGADHTFGTDHPFESKIFPAHFSEVFNKTIAFLKS